MMDDSPAERMTKQEFLANRFSHGDVNNLQVSARRLDYWAAQFDNDSWNIPKKYEKRYKKLKAKEK